MWRAEQVWNIPLFPHSGHALQGTLPVEICHVIYYRRLSKPEAARGTSDRAIPVKTTKSSQ
jgi:hypothetical protein